MNLPCLPCCKMKRSKLATTDSEFSHYSRELNETEPLKARESLVTRDFIDEIRINGSNSTGLARLENKLRALHELIKSAIDRDIDREQKTTLQKEFDVEWLSVALVLDRLFFISYLIVIIVSLVCLFPRKR